MSGAKDKRIWLTILIAIFSLLVFGCENKTPVDNIYFDLGNGQKQMVLLVDQEIEMSDFVVVAPSYASNKGFELWSSDESVIKVSGTKITALKKGSATIIATSSDNANKQAVMTISVEQEKTTLATPKNFKYNSSSQSFTFDSVLNASGYTVKINGVEYNIGNSTSFALSQCLEGAYDKVVVAQVRANSPSYSYAFEQSSYSTEQKIFQRSEVSSVSVKGGNLSFEKTVATKYNIYLNNELFLENTEENTVSLLNLDKKFDGLKVQVGVSAVIEEEVEEVFGNDVDYYNSLIESVSVDVLNSISPVIESSMVTWQPNSSVARYDVFVEGNKVASVEDASLNLASLESFDDYDEEVACKLKIVPILRADIERVAVSNKVNEINFSKIKAPTLTFDGDVLKWASVANALSYNLSISYDEGNYPLTNLIANEFSLAEFPSDKNYTIRMQANAVGLLEGVYYVPSSFATKTVKKQSEVDVTNAISEYWLQIPTTVGDYYTISFAINDETNFEQTKKVDGESYSLNLSAMDFKAGEHEILIVHNGDNNETIDSKPAIARFVQLEGPASASISNGVLTVDKGGLNQEFNASVKINIADTDYTYLGEEYEFNTTINEPGMDYLAAGDYITQVQILGDGSSTFSWKGVTEISIKVLAAPSCAFPDNSISKITFENTDKSESFAVYKVEDEQNIFIENITANEYSFDIENDLITLIVQALGDEENVLDSCLSDPITINQLKQASAKFNNVSNIISKIDTLNNQDYVNGYELKHNGEIVSYDFTSAFNGLIVGENQFGLVVKAKSGTNYLDSVPYAFNITKIDNNCTVLVSEENNLIIVPTNQTNEYSLELVLTLNGVQKTFKSESGELVCDGLSSLPYEFIDGEYIISLIDESYNVRISDLEKTFGVSVKFIEPSTGDDSVANSDYTANQNLDINKLDILQLVTISQDNKLIITTTDSTQYLVRLNIGLSEDLLFVSNGSNLVCGGYSLPYTFDAGVYSVDLLKSNYEPIIAEMTTSFTVQVQFSENTDGNNSSTDSLMSAEKTITLLPTVELERYEQVLMFDSKMPTYTLNHYELVINGEIIVPITDLGATMNASDIQIKLEAIADYAAANGVDDPIIKIAVATLNLETTEDAPLLTSLSEEMFIEQQQTVEISSFKYNNNEDEKNNNSVVINISTITTEYEKSYIAEIYNMGKTNIARKEFLEKDVSEGAIQFNLDDYLLSGDIYVSVYIATIGEHTVDGNKVYVFNSKDSNVLEFEKIAGPANLSASQRTISFDAVENAVGYEIYEKNFDGTYTKINENLIVSTNYTLENISGLKEIVVKAISVASVNGGYTNSNFSESIVINKLASPSANFVYGDFEFTLSTDVVTLLDTEGVDLYLEAITLAHNEANPIIIDLKQKTEGVVIEGNKMTVEAYLLLSYNSVPPTSENIKLTFKTNYVDSGVDQAIYYLNSDASTYSVYGLISPSSLKVSTDTVDGEVIAEMLSWTPSDKNIIADSSVSYGYVFKIKYTHNEQTLTVLSNDSNLKYKSNEELFSYAQAIDGTSCVFPCGYEAEEGFVEFGAGTYVVSIKVVPTSKLTGYDICSSNYSLEHTFTILEQAKPSVKDGKIVWDKQEDATSYYVQISKGGVTKSETTTDAELDIVNSALNNIDGFCEITVQAYSDKSNVLTGKKSEKLLVFRLPNSATATENQTKVEIDDGNVVLTANQLFSSAEISFINGSEVRTIPFNNFEASQELLNSFEIAEWGEFDQTSADEMAKILQQKRYIIKAPTEVLDLVQGNSYSINVRLVGNTSEKLGIVSSPIIVSANNILVSKLKPNTNEVEYGVIKYTLDDKYSLDGYANINYNFNNQASVEELWQHLIIYRINITTKTKVLNEDNEWVETTTVHSIYTVDYYSFIAASEYIPEGTFVETPGLSNLYGYLKFPYIDADDQPQNLYFNIYAVDDGKGNINGNIINLRDYDYIYYYAINKVEENGVLSYTGNVSTTRVDLSVGGSFAVEITMLGGDQYAVDEDNFAYLTSSVSVMNVFYRYGDNILATHEGMVRLQDLSPVDDGVVVDYPVYKIGVTPLNTENTTIVYLYYDNKEDAEDIAKRNGESDLSKVHFVQLSIAKDGGILFDLAKYFDAGAYTLSIQTLAGFGTGESEDQHYLLNSKVKVGGDDYLRLSDTEFAINSEGKLEFNLAYVEQDKVKTPTYEYEITLLEFDGGGEISQTYVYEINKTSEGVEYNSSTQKYIYTIPSEITLEEGCLKVLEGVNYKIKVKALSSGNFIINGTYKENESEDVVTPFIKSYGATNIEVDDGILKWKVQDIDSYTSVFIRAVDENTGEVLTLSTAGTRVDVDDVYSYHYHALNTSFKYADSATYSLLNSNTTYKLTLYVVGNPSEGIINSNYTTEIPLNRVEEVIASSVVSQDGILTWQPSASAVGYRVKLTGSATHEFLTTKPSLDFAIDRDIKEGYLTIAGSYSVFITALGDDFISSKETAEISGFVKLEDVKNIRISSGQIVWDAINIAENSGITFGYEITFNYTNTSGEEISDTLDPVSSETLAIDAPNDIDGLFKVQIKAVSIGEGKALNSNVSEFESSTNVPSQVSKVEFDEDDFRYYWSVTEDFLSSDKLLIVYNFEKFEHDASNAPDEMPSGRLEISAKQDGYYDSAKDMYYFPLTVIGKYSNFSVQVIREGTVPSVSSAGEAFEFDIFNYGGGTETNAYRISTAEELLNIRCFPGANYELISAINMAGVETTNSYIIAEEFNGSINGNDYAIFGFNKDTIAKTDTISLSNSTQFALFGMLNNAKISNLVLGEQEYQTILLNSFAFNNQNGVKLSLIATGANNSIIEKVNVLNLNIVVQATSNEKLTDADVLISGLIAEANNTSIINSTIQLTTQINISCTSSIYVGGLVAKANNVGITEKSSALLTLSTSAGVIFNCVGGLIGYYNADENANGVFNSSAELTLSNVNVVNLGGLVGRANYITIQNSSTVGTISHAAVSIGTINWGGLVGMAQSSTITSSGTKIDFTISVLSNERKYVGAIVGNITVLDEADSCYIDTCYYASQNEFANLTTITSIGSSYQVVVGSCGFIGSYVEVRQNCYVTATQN